MPRILFVSGFHPATRARDLAYEFERFGPLVRCDVPAPRNPHASHNPRWKNKKNSGVGRKSNRLSHFAARSQPLRALAVPPPVEILRAVDVDYFTSNAVERLAAISMSPRERKHERSTIPRTPRSYAFVEFRSNRDAEDAYYDMHGRYFEGSRLSIQWAKNPPSSVWRYDRRTPPPSYRSRDRSRSPPRRREERDSRDDRGDRRRRSRSPERERRRTPSPVPERRRDDRDRGDRVKTPPPVEEVKKDEEREKEQVHTPPYDH